MPHRILEEKLLKLLTEDLGLGDVTTSLIVSEGANAEASVIAKEAGVAAGIEEARVLLQSLGLKVDASLKDGEKIRSKQVIMRISGDARTILAAERTMLNLLSRMSGIATTTSRLIDRFQKAKLKTRLACTRKTAPGLMYFDKKAVMIGGGDTHRFHLDDMILIKDNHLVLVGSVEKAVKRAREQASLSKKIEVEVTNIDDALHAVDAGADIVMLDNFAPRQIRKVVTALERKNLRSKILLETSGGITEENVMSFASTGVDIMSMGEITHSAKALDISLEITRKKKT